MTLLDVHGVSYRAGNKLLVDEVTLTVAAGEVVALVGPNGAGKTTTVRLIGGDIRSDGGTIRLGGSEMESLSPREAARRRSVMSQHTTVRFPFRAIDVVMMGRFPLDTDRFTDRQASERMMERTDTRELAGEFFPVLSSGEQARVNLARTLVQEARLVVLDEPVASLDVRHEQLVMRLLRETAAGGVGCLVVLHDLNLAATHADRLALMAGGKIVREGTPAEVLDGRLLSEVYRQPMSVLPHPERDGMLVLVRDD